MKLVFDTNILIDHLRGGEVFSKLAERIEEDTDLYLPSITVMELFAGRSSGDNKVERKILALLRNFQIVGFDMEIAQAAGEIYRDGNQQLEVPDYIVAATALKLKAEIVTLNEKHFKLISGVELFEL
jgi:tRNA(fMet)-specific endonuclease VapC